MRAQNAKGLRCTSNDSYIIHLAANGHSPIAVVICAIRDLCGCSYVGIVAQSISNDHPAALVCSLRNLQSFGTGTRRAGYNAIPLSVACGQDTCSFWGFFVHICL